MNHNKRKPYSRANELINITSVLIGKQLTEVWYHDGLNEKDGNAFFLEDLDPNRHELMFGIDLVTSDGTTVGFHWVWIKDYELGVTPKGVSSLHKTRWAPFDQSDEEHWALRLSKTISNLVFSTNTDGYLCDCRIDFDSADSIWICARQGTCKQDSENFMFNGDDTIVVFTEQEARRLGIKTDA